MSLHNQVDERRRAEERSKCYDSGGFSAAASLRVILGNGESWLFPWHRFLNAKFAGDRLVLTFAEYRVEIHGRNLGYPFEKYVAEFTLRMIRELPAEYAAVADPKDTFITEIRILPADS